MGVLGPALLLAMRRPRVWVGRGRVVARLSSKPYLRSLQGPPQARLGRSRSGRARARLAALRGWHAPEPVARQLVREVLRIHVRVLGRRGELASVRLQQPGHVGALELL